ncbi:CAMK family protein kinase [Trichomonas vaginalis G3]|uniref:CAMK family protein kinase n=1 Tax=Trichomonas vaginalis (strain ATCC PRA-98 / G3) TaxID=412133 RepID=A2G058_TRIV3|nr:protein kinase protein [Trichomonas vaginalis G3]EAX89460.1 CAMK family protein kinase [Trichomonas vaginalis G3]KAI5485307.1 protein kinase protein [Trichomonas vaginalis G3]|eukprot:XP_001302390.1 CAMK family protein kinase [Trichomonas vaginalis G3]
MSSILPNHGYQILSEIDSGKFSHCYLCKSLKYETEFVCKVIHALDKELKENYRATFKQELTVLSNFIHPNIIGVYDAFEEGDDYVLVLEYCENGTLQDKVSNNATLEPEQVINYAKQILSALSYMHDKNVAHHDVKPSNIFIDKFGRIKLADFGIAQSFAENQSKSCIFGGTVAFMAPEQFKKLPYSAFQSDIWAFGVTLYTIAFGRLPFFGHNVHEVISNICTGVYSLPSHCPKELRTVFQHSLDPNPETRWTAKKLLESLNMSTSYSTLVKRPKISNQKSVPNSLWLQMPNLAAPPTQSNPKTKPTLVIPRRTRRNSGCI